MGNRAGLVKRMQEIMGTQWFRYGSYLSRPTHLPYGNYSECPRHYIYGSDRVLLKIKRYILRIVCATKDFDLEDTIEDIFDEMDFPYEKITDEYIDKEKVHVTEWEFDILEPGKNEPEPEPEPEPELEVPNE